MGLLDRQDPPEFLPPGAPMPHDFTPSSAGPRMNDEGEAAGDAYAPPERIHIERFGRCSPRRWRAAAPKEGDADNATVRRCETCATACAATSCSTRTGQHPGLRAAGAGMDVPYSCKSGV